NNARQDCTPYIMTANHCGIGAGNAPSLVTYWNFMNSTCRQPNSPASGSGGDGQLNDFNTGATWRASNPPTDMTIVELDDDVSPTANAFYAGWDNSMPAPADTMIAVHHPSTDEKRISFSFQDPFITNGFNGPTDPNGTHIEIPDWDIGTTEPGSSGSPVFDRFRRVRGQLHGGGAACGNDQYDTYGYFGRSWEGGGSSSSRLRDWLDPDNSGVTFIDGKEQLSCQISVSANPAFMTGCAGTPVTSSLLVGGGFENDVTLSFEDLPGNISAEFSQNPVPPNTTVTVTFTTTPGTAITESFTLSATDGNFSSQTSMSVDLTQAAPFAPLLNAPGNGATEVEVSPSFNWAASGAESFEFELAADASFSVVLVTETPTMNSITPAVLLNGQTTYFWRVRSANPCGNSDWSETFTFTTANVACAALSSEDVPVNISEDGTPEILSTLDISSTDPVEDLIVDVDISHSFVGDLLLELTSPEGTTVLLVDRMGVPAGDFGCGEDNLLLTFSDAAPNSADDLENTCGGTGQPYAALGEYQPIDPLSAFDDENPEGT
ncbi:MAG: proprotein convertase P-domain-containing protein, partial [Bacteroidota bacterium]